MCRRVADSMSLLLIKCIASCGPVVNLEITSAKRLSRVVGSSVNIVSRVYNLNLASLFENVITLCMDKDRDKKKLKRYDSLSDFVV